VRFKERTGWNNSGSLNKTLTVAHERKPSHLNQLPNRTSEAGADEAQHASQSRANSAESNSRYGLYDL